MRLQFAISIVIIFVTDVRRCTSQILVIEKWA